MKFDFNLYEGIEGQSGISRVSESSPEDQSSIASNSNSPSRSFIPRTPSSSKIQRGERGELVRKMVNALRQQVEETRGNFPESGEVIESSNPATDLQSIDSEIRLILNSFGIFFFSQVPQHIITTYGSLLSSRGEDEQYQRLIESNLSNEDYFDTKVEQLPLFSQDEIS